MKNFDDQILAAAFFSDLLFYLNESKRGLELTQTGNLKLKEIKLFGDNFKYDIYHRGKDGSIMFPIRSEERVYYLQRIRQVAEVMHLIYKRGGKLKLSKNGQSFLKLDILDRYKQVLLSFCNECSWTFYYYAMADDEVPLKDIIQKGQSLMWEYFLERDGQIKFADFYSFIKKNLLPKYKERYQTLHFEIQKIIQDFVSMGVFEVKAAKRKYCSEEIEQFQLTELGKETIEYVVENIDFENANAIKNKNTILPQIQFKYVKFVDENGERPITKGAVCVYCKKRGIIIGGGIGGHTDDPKPICEECAIDRYMKEEGFSSRESAASHRRRIFDIKYLLQEILTEQYMKANKIKDIENIDANGLDFLLQFSTKQWNEEFSRKEKLKLEKTQDQKVIEKELKKKLGIS